MGRHLFAGKSACVPKPSPAESQLGAIKANFLGHSFLPSGMSSNASKVALLVEIPIIKGTKELRSLLGGLLYHRKLFPLLAKQVQSLNLLLKTGAQFEFTQKKETTVRA